MSRAETSKFFSRALFLGGFQICLVLLLFSRMVYLQIIEGSYYRVLADGNRIVTRPLVPLRGRVYDKNGILLVENETNFKLLLLADKKKDIEVALASLEAVISLSPEAKEEILKKAQKRQGVESLVIKDNLTWDEVSAIELHAMDLPGMTIEIGSKRRYPFAAEGAHLLGYVSSPSEKEEEEDPSLGIPGLKIGKSGFEKYLNQRLKGTPGYSALEVNARRKIVRELNQIESIPGEDICLTIDERLQRYAYEVLS